MKCVTPEDSEVCNNLGNLCRIDLDTHPYPRSKEQSSALIGSPQGHRDDEAVAAVRRVHDAVDRQFFGVDRWVIDRDCRSRINTIKDFATECLTIISGLANADQIRPLQMIKVSNHDDPVYIDKRVPRIGFYPLSANPLHWGHVLVGLAAMALLHMDKIVFLIADEDQRKPSMMSADTRHRLARAIIETFHPLFAYSSLALGSNLDGETNLERLLWLNPKQSMEVFYIAGTDHCRRITEGGEPDTIEKLERIVKKRKKSGEGLQTISAAFIDRVGVVSRELSVATFLNVRVLPSLPLSFSSTDVRRTLGEKSFSDALGSLPYSYLQEIKAERLYL